MSTPVYFNFKMSSEFLHDLMKTLMDPTAGNINGISLCYNDSCSEATIKIDFHYTETNPASMTLVAQMSYD